MKADVSGCPRSSAIEVSLSALLCQICRKTIVSTYGVSTYGVDLVFRFIRCLMWRVDEKEF